MLASAFVNTLADHDYLFRVRPTLRLYQLQARPAHRGGSPYGLQDSLCTLRVSCSDIRCLSWWIVGRADSQCPFSIWVIPTRFPGRASAIHATLDTGDWLGLTRRGLAPRKMRQASLGALTLRSAVFHQTLEWNNQLFVRQAR